MRPLPLIAVLAMLAAAPSAQARLFRHTYGATVATDSGCAWNINQDYFVPRHCDSCRYDLLSPCKTYHTTSAACKHLHPIYAGYCTPYGACRYHWRDHVYKVHCGCKPLKCVYGPWRLERFGPAGCSLDGEASGGEVCRGESIASMAVTEFAPDGLPCADSAILLNVEPMGGVILGSVAALPGGSGGAAAAASAVPTAVEPAGILPSLGLTPPDSPPGKGALPPVSSF